MNSDEKNISQKVNEYFQIAADKYDVSFPDIDVKFTLKGTTSGNCGVYLGGKIVLNFNMEIFKLNREKFYEVIIHEVSHGIAFRKYKLTKVRPHGKEWEEIVIELGGIPERCHNYKTPVSKKKIFECLCNCQTHLVSKTIYKKIGLGYCYSCKSCNGVIRRGAI